MSITANAAANVGIGALKTITAMMQMANNDSYVEYTKAMRVEPIVLIDSDCMFHDGLPDLMQTLQSIFCGYYLQAVAIATTIGRISVVGQLGKLNPNRDPIDSMEPTGGYGEIGKVMSMLGAESYEYGLPTFKKLGVKPGLEAMAYKTQAEAQAEADKLNKHLATEAAKEKEKGLNVTLGRDVGQNIAEAANLSVGKVLSVEITDGNAKGVFPVTVRLLVNSVPTNSLIHILSPSSQDTSWKARWHAWKAGRLETIKDMIFCQDLIDAHRKKLMDDSTGHYGQIVDRKTKNTLATILSGNPSVATCSNMLVLSDTTQAKLELESGLQLKSFNDRQKLFNETSLMIMAVIDKRWDRVTIYTRSIPESTTVTFRDMKVGNKGNGPDVAEILKAYQLGNSPSI